jgi:hypothetical protein
VLVGSFVWCRPGLCQCRFRVGYTGLHIGPKAPNFLQLAPALAPPVPVETGSTTASPQAWSHSPPTPPSLPPPQAPFGSTTDTGMFRGAAAVGGGFGAQPAFGAVRPPPPAQPSTC